MKTDAVMCMALTRTRPSWTPLFRTTSSTCLVMLTKAIRAGRLKVRCSVCDFMGRPWVAGSGISGFRVVPPHYTTRVSGKEVGAEVLQPAVADEEGDG